MPGAENGSRNRWRPLAFAWTYPPHPANIGCNNSPKDSQEKLLTLEKGHKKAPCYRVAMSALRCFQAPYEKKDSTKCEKCKEKSSGIARIWMFFIIGGQRHVGKFYLLSYFKAVARIRSAKGIISSSFSMSSFASLFSPSNSPTLHCFPLKYSRHRGLSLLSSRRMEQ